MRSAAFPKCSLTVTCDQMERELTEVNLPKNSMEKLKCLVPAKQKKREKNIQKDDSPTPENGGEGISEGDFVQIILTTFVSLSSNLLES